MLALLSERSLPREELELRIRSAVSRWRRIVELNLGREIADRKRRPFFELIVARDGVESLDIMKTLISSLREGVEEIGADFEALIPYLAGVKYGDKMVRAKLVKSLDDLPYAFAVTGVGLIDVVVEKLDRMVVRIFECVSCYGHEAVGKTMCYFEMGILRSVLKHLYGENRVIERKCWGLGNQFCEFVILYQ